MDLEPVGNVRQTRRVGGSRLEQALAAPGFPLERHCARFGCLEGSWSCPWAAWRGAEVSQGIVTKRGPRDLPPTGHMGGFQLRGCSALTAVPRGTVTLSVPRGPSPLRLPQRTCAYRDTLGTSFPRPVLRDTYPQGCLRNWNAPE